MPNVVVITGGIGSGKSTVVERFKYLGVPCISADDVVNAAYKDASNGCCQLVAEIFGQDLIVNGEIDRISLRERLTTQQDYDTLGNIWSGYVRQQLIDFGDKFPSEPYVVWEVPLAVESGWTGDILIAVVAPDETRIQRVMARSKLSYEQVVLRMHCQAKLPEILAKADFVIPNNSDLDTLHHRVDVLQSGLRQWINL